MYLVFRYGLNGEASRGSWTMKEVADLASLFDTP
jgi:hypothetical protein